MTAPTLKDKIPDYVCDSMSETLEDMIKNPDKYYEKSNQSLKRFQKLIDDSFKNKKDEVPTEQEYTKHYPHSHSDADVVNSPSHYQFSKYEPIKVIQAWDLSFALGNVVKYIARAGRKDSSKLIEDLEKAKRYLELELEDLRSKV